MTITWKGLERTRTQNVRNAIEITYEDSLHSSKPSTYGIVPDTTADMSANFTAAIAGAGHYLQITAAGTYDLYSTVVIPDHFILDLWPGVILKGHDIPRVISMAGTESTTTFALTQNVGMGQQDALKVASTASFTAGQWIYLEDLRADHNNPPGTSGQKHLELNRIRSVTNGTDFVLYYPTVDSYAFADTALVRFVTPCENSFVTGGGKITNTGTSNTTGGHGVKMECAVGCHVTGMEVTDCRNQCVSVLNSLSCFVTECNIHDTPVFNANNTGNGYGVSTTGAVGTVIANNTIRRCRHLVDVSYWSRSTTVMGNTMHAAGFASVSLHPDTYDTIVVGNNIDGARGYSTPDPATEMADGSGTGISAPGIVVRAFGKNVVIANNTIRNTWIGGVNINENGCENILIAGNTLYNCNIRDVPTGAGIYCVANTVGDTCVGLVIANNIVSNPSWAGILVNYDYAIICGNMVRNVATASGTEGAGSGILISPKVAQGINYVQVFNNTVYGAVGWGVFLGGTGLGGSGDVTYTSVKNNDCVNSTKGGIFVQQRPTVLVYNYTIERNRITAFNFADDQNQGAIVAVEENTVTQTAGKTYGYIGYNTINFQSVGYYGIVAGMSGQVVEGNVVRGATDAGAASGVGIWIRAKNPASTVSKMIVRNNVAANCVTNGIRVGSPSGAGTISNAKISGNVCDSNGTAGIDNEVQTSDNVIVGNFCHDASAATSYGILDNGTNAKVIWNTCINLSGNQKYGVYAGASSVNCSLHDNFCVGNVTGGTVIDASATTTQLFRESPSFAALATTTVSNTTTETSLISGTTQGSKNFIVKAGTVIKIRASGVYGTQAVPVALRIRVKKGTTVILDTGAQVPTGGLTARVWDLEAVLTGRSATTIIGQALLRLSTAAVGSSSFEMNNGTAAVTVGGGVEALDITAQWSAGVAAADTISLTNLTFEVLEQIA